MAYSFTEPTGGAGGADGEDESDTEEAESAPPPMMVPLADILNHVAKNNAALTFRKEALRMVSTRDIKKVGGEGQSGFTPHRPMHVSSGQKNLIFCMQVHLWQTNA